MTVDNLHVVAGLGASGFSCVRYLKEKGLLVAVTDTRTNPPHLAALNTLYPDVIVSLGGLNAELLGRAAAIVLSPGLALTEPSIAEQMKRGRQIIGDIELFAREVNVPVIAITGTNAKSTVTTLVGKMAEAAGYQVQTGGNLGIPALDLLSKKPAADLFVLELSSFQLETTYSLKPRVASILNITPDHLDRYKNFGEYQQAKYRIYHGCHTAVSNRDDELTTCHENINGQKLFFTLNPPRQQEFGLIVKNNTAYLAHENKLLLPVNELPVRGKHYQANALAALAIGKGFGLPLDAMLNVLQEFKGLDHRCQLVRERRGVKWYNDSKGTNVGATQAAVEGLGSEIEGKLIMIMGGAGKNADFKPMVPVLEKYSRHVILIGEAAGDLASAINGRIPITFAQAMEEAVQQADTFAQVHDSVLLSPACASLDMFNNYEHRGRVFTECVLSLNG